MTSRRRTAVKPLFGGGEEIPLVTVLSNRRRRLVVAVLDAAERPLELDTLARGVAVRETGVPASVLSEETAREVCLSLYNNHLPVLCARDVVEVRPRQSLVAPGDRFAEATKHLSRETEG